MEYASLSRAAQVARIRGLGLDALRQFGVHPRRMSLLVHLENTTFKVESPEGVFNLRVQRPGYQTAETTASELLFMEHLRSHGLPAPEPMHALDGRTIVSASGPGLAEPRNCELFRWVEGKFLRSSYGPAHTRLVGSLMARFHAAALEFKPPAWFTRRRLTEDDEYASPTAEWFLQGEAPFMNPERQAKLKGALDRGREAMRELGEGPDVFGLIHADLHHGNLVWRGGRPHAIDFDDLAYAYYLWDFATALAFTIGRPNFREMRDAMLAGYEEVAPLPPRTRELLPVFIDLRHYTLIRWVVERSDNPELVAKGESWVGYWADRLGTAAL